MHVELAPRRRESVVASWRAGRGEVHPDLRGGVVAVEIVDVAVDTESPVNVELAPRRRESVVASWRRRGAGSGCGEVWGTPGEHPRSFPNKKNEIFFSRKIL